jgi:SAM-dependent methyltransferase
VFEALAAGPLTPAAAATRLAADQRATFLLLQTLEGLGYVKRVGASYANTAATRKWLLANSPTSMAAGLEFWGMVLTTLWQDFEGTIRHGRPAVDFYGWLEAHPATLAAFQQWLRASAHQTAGEIARRVSLPPTARRLLDAGGGHGYYSVAFCRRYPGLAATVLDFPSALDSARATIAAEHMAGRVTVAAGDLLRDPFGSGYDAVLLFHVIHGHTPEQNVALLKKAAAALQPGGRVVILDQLAGSAPTRASRALGSVLAFSFFQLVGAQTYSFSQITGWFQAAGLGEARKMTLLTSPVSSLVMATKGA